MPSSEQLEIAAAQIVGEMRLTAGPTPAALQAAVVEREGFVATRDAFLLTATDTLSFFYQRGSGIHYSAAPAVNTAAVASFHYGSVYGAVAWMNGLLPLHASAVVAGQSVHAFAGASGAGKSTLTAALCGRGLSVFADDVLTVHVEEGRPPFALPGHKRLKLWADALALTGQTRQERVWPGVEKFFVDVPIVNSAPRQLASLTVLEASPSAEIKIERLHGAGRLIALRDCCYRAEYRSPDRNLAVFAQIAAVAEEVQVFRFSRPRDPSRFAEGIDLMMEHIERRIA